MRRVVLSVAMLTTVICAAGLAFAPAKHGSEPYTPTKLDWLCVVMQGRLGPLMFGSNLICTIVPDHESDSVLINVVYPQDMDRKALNNAVKNAREMIETAAKGPGWDSWIQIREKLIQLPAQSTATK